jgi:hypothetical protein
MTQQSTIKKQPLRELLKAAVFASPAALGGLGAGAALADGADGLNFYTQEAPVVSYETGVYTVAQNTDAAQSVVPAMAAPQAFVQPMQASIIPAGLGTALTNPLSVGPITFGAPWVLLGFMSFPLLWILMRSTPPSPRREEFPAIRLLFNLQAQDQEPSKMPLWQRLLRLAMAGTVIVALADPQMNDSANFEGEGPVVILVDNGWASAPNWDERREQIESLIEKAERENRAVSLITTALPSEGGALIQTPPVIASDARDVLARIQPQAWPVDRAAALDALEAMRERGVLDGSSVFWLSNGLEDEVTEEFNAFLSELGEVNTYLPDNDNAPYLLREPSYEGDILRMDVLRSSPVTDGAEDESLTLTAYDAQGRPLMQTNVSFGVGEQSAVAEFTIPIEVRNEITRIAINGERHAGATLLLDERWRLRPVGIFEAVSDQGEQQLLSEDNYVATALEQYADVEVGTITDIMEGRGQSIIILPDSVSLSMEERAALENWIEEGGTLLRFAGPRLAAAIDAGFEDELLPVRLRSGVRVLDENFSGASPLGFADLERESPLYGVGVDAKAQVTRQLLAVPDRDLDDHVWARLEDGTPIVTAREMGQGTTILVHTTSNTDWSNLVLSGMFVEMMRAVVSHSNGLEGSAMAPGVSEPPVVSLNAQGRLDTPPPTAQAINAEVIDAGIISPQYPAGYYGSGQGRFAYNLSRAVPTFDALEASEMPTAINTLSYESAKKEYDLKGVILAGAFMLALTDMGIMLGQRGALPFTGRRRRKGAQSRVARP